MSSATGLPATWSPCWLQPFADSLIGGAAAPAREKIAGRYKGKGWSPTDGAGSKGGAQ